MTFWKDQKFKWNNRKHKDCVAKKQLILQKNKKFLSPYRGFLLLCNSYYF